MYKYALAKQYVAFYIFFSHNMKSNNIYHILMDLSRKQMLQLKMGFYTIFSFFILCKCFFFFALSNYESIYVPMFIDINGILI